MVNVLLHTASVNFRLKSGLDTHAHTKRVAEFGGGVDCLFIVAQSLLQTGIPHLRYCCGDDVETVKRKILIVPLK